MLLSSWTAPARAQAPSGSALANDYVVVEPRAGYRAVAPDLLFLNRCPAGCLITRGDTSHAPSDVSSVIGNTGTLSPFAFDQARWDAVVACVTDTFAAYGVTVVTTEPEGQPYNEVFVAGEPEEVGVLSSALGIAPLNNNCTAQADSVSFAFANGHQGGNAIEICATVAHEAGHLYGLDHAFECRDPMTYLIGCGDKRFINWSSPCGEFDNPRECLCDAEQNSHQHLARELGLGAPVPPPVVEIVYPQQGASVPAGTTVFASFDAPRMAIRAELWINGRRWAEVPLGPEDDLAMISMPAAVPDGVLNIDLRIVGDVGNIGSASVTVSKGAPCASSDACGTGFVCDAGACNAVIGTSAVGDACNSDTDCADQRCLDFMGEKTCSRDCLVGLAEQCPATYECVQASDRETEGLCFDLDAVTEPAGCCSGAPVSGAWPALALLGLGFGRRRRRPTR